MPCSNIYTAIDIPDRGEKFETLLEKKNVTIKRILSSADIEQQVMIQEEDEWFIMIEGAALIMIDKEKRELQKGDYCFIKAGTAHQILFVKEGTIWLAVHF